MKGASLVDNSYRTRRKIVSPQAFGIRLDVRVQIRHILPSPLIKLVALDN